MKNIKEEHTFAGNYILEVEHEYIAGSVKAFYAEPGFPLVPLAVSEIGAKYIGIPEASPLTKTTKLHIEYLTEAGEIRIRMNERLLALEEKVEAQQLVIENMLEALRNRVDTQTFNMYLKALEERIGLKASFSFPKPYVKGSV